MYRIARIYLLTYAISTYATSFVALHDQADQHAALTQRAHQFSGALLGKPYHAFLLGDGPSETLDTRPLYNLEAFDCLTYVETVLALAHSYDRDTFEQRYIAIKYTGSTPTFATRNHFTNVQWNTNAYQLGWLTDYTRSIKDAQQQPIALTLTTDINIPGWFNTLASNDALWYRYTQQHLTADVQAQLHYLSQQSQATRSTISYIPHKAIIDAQGAINPAIAKQLPPFSVVEFVRINWPHNNTLGTHLDVSHIGFLIRSNNKVTLRHASEIIGTVTDEDFGLYLLRLAEQASFAGIHLERIND